MPLIKGFTFYNSLFMETIYQFFDQNLMMIYLLMLTIILGFEVISKVPTVLHTPLMSGANAISGVVIIGAILLIRQAQPDDYLTLSLGLLGIVLGMVNVAGGFAVTDRMLEMFKKKKK
jgi:NAD(P) transhydrogenase subunit alpha